MEDINISSRPDQSMNLSSISTTNPSSNDDEINNTGVSSPLSEQKMHASGHKGEEWAQIERLISRMFGSERKTNPEEEKTRYSGVVWKSLTVKGIGLGAAFQPTNGDMLLSIPRLVKKLFTGGRRGTRVAKPELRAILDGFTGCVRPGEMLLVLGRPGSGCSSFLKVIGNQRSLRRN
ncbi:CDR ABC transporter [Penicillium angulare]|uniref:CDR ABC transporter n=1 Tax=Penicillium angulare TaxID=116970 RepID=UPI002540174B|nr:CDR ABC transporter [Penicillium angulare]KAJ5287464.1 CDR ABC transporter [Penicillium angulare]